MKLEFSKLMGALIAMLMSTSAALADDPTQDALHPVRLVEITSDFYKGETYYLGYMESADHAIQKFFYEDEKHVITYYTWQQVMTGDIPIIQTTYNGTVYDLVRVSLDQNLGEKSYQIYLSYLKNAITGGRRVNTLKLAYNPQINNYEILYGLKVEEPVTKALAVTNYVGSIPVGIDYVVYSK